LLQRQVSTHAEQPHQEAHTFPEVPDGKVTSIHPRLVSLTIKEPPILRTDRDVEDKIELLIKRRIFTTVLPRIIIQRSVLRSQRRKTTLLPQRVIFIELRVVDLLEAAIEVHEDVVLGPLKTEGVEASGEVAAAQERGAVRADVAVVLVRGAPVHGRGHEVATFGVLVAVAAELGDVDFAGARPCAVDVVLGHHP